LGGYENFKMGSRLTNFEIFGIIIVLLLLSWSTVSFWQRFLENLAFGTLGFDPRDTWVTFWLALAVTAAFIFLVWIIKMLIFPDVDIRLVGTEDGDAGEGPLGYEGVIGDRFSPSILEPVGPVAPGGVRF